MGMETRLPSPAKLPPRALSSFPLPSLPFRLCSVLAANCTHEHVEKLIYSALHQQVSSPQAQASVASSRWFCYYMDFQQRLFPLA